MTVPGVPVPDADPEPDLKLPHETVFERLRESPLSATSTSEVVSGREVIELPVPAKRGDAFMGSGKYLRAANKNGWEHRATYTRIRVTSAKGAARYVAACAIAFRRGTERVVGYWRTNAKGAYVFAWAQRRTDPRDAFGAAPLSGTGLAAVLALPAVPCAGCSRVLAAHRPAVSEPEEAA